jgi:hypothetical protein
MSGYCPICQNNTCDCDWGLDELYESWRLDSCPNMDLQQTGSTGSCDHSSDGCIGLPVFDSAYANVGNPMSNPHLPNYKSAIIDSEIHKVGDLVNYYPLWGAYEEYSKVWIVKRVFSFDPLDCSFYDYEITDGQKDRLVTYYELKKLEEK